MAEPEPEPEQALVRIASSFQLNDRVQFEDFIAQVQLLRDPEERYLIYETIARRTESAQEMLDDVTEQTWNTMRNDTAAWNTTYGTYEEFQDNYSSLRQRAEAAANRRNYREESIRSLQNTGLASEDWSQILPRGESSDTLIKAASKCAKAMNRHRITPEMTIRAINHVIVQRLKSTKRGGVRFRGPATRDYAEVAKMASAEVKKALPYTDADLEPLGLRRSSSGIVVETTDTDVATTTVQELPSPESATGALVPPAGGPNDPPALAGSKRPHGSTSGSSALSDPPRSDTHSPIPSRPRPRRSTKRPHTYTEDDSPAGGEPSERDPSPTGTIRLEKCGCDNAIEEKFQKVSVRQEKKSAVLPTEAGRLSLARQFKSYIDAGLFVCSKHTKSTATAVGLRTRFSAEVLKERLVTYAASRRTVGTLKTDINTYSWFAQSVRSLHPAEIRGVYKYDIVDLTQNTTFQPDVEQILKKLSMDYQVDIAAQFNKDGNVNIPIFAWWFRTEIGKANNRAFTMASLARNEFEMYRWHFRAESGNSGSLGWLRNMYYSGAQQIIRQDPEYYRAYVALRPDHHWRLIAYPYYAKYATDEDSTFFRHIDINITQYLEDGRAGNMIQGSVSLTDETRDMCTEIIPGFHTHDRIASWYERVKARFGDKKVMDAYVNSIQDKKIWSPEDIEHFATDFTPVPCKEGDVRITSPLLPHGSTTMPKGGVRRTILPWFVAIQDNHMDMETIEQGTWKEIADAHRALEAAPRTPSGKPNMYGGIPYRFPASLPLILNSPLSNALVGRTKWDMPDVIEERDIVLGADHDQYEKWLKRWRDEACKAYIAHFKRIRELEIRLYGPKSYWANKGDVSKAPPADSEMTEEIRQEIIERQGSKFGSEIHGQEGAIPGTVKGAPSEKELRSSPSELISILEDNNVQQGSPAPDIIGSDPATERAVAGLREDDQGIGWEECLRLLSSENDGEAWS